MRVLPFAFLLSWTLLPTQAQDQGQSSIHVPDSSLEGPSDIGVRSHTNHLILLKPAGGLGPAGGLSPDQLRSCYTLPSSGGGGVIAIVDAFDYPTALADFNTFSDQFGLPHEYSNDPTSSTNPVFQVVYAGGVRPKSNTGWSQEAALDIEWAHAMAPGAKIVLVEAHSNNNADLFEAVDVAAKLPGVRQVSMSWGSNENSGETEYDIHFNLPTPTSHKSPPPPVFLAASGDVGGKTGYPAASQYVVAVGGTSVATTTPGGAFAGESGWSGSGGGISPYEPRPSWQTHLTVNGSMVNGTTRLMPDISADADPNTGVAVFAPKSAGKGSIWQVFGGTSVSTPCVAGMVNLGGKTYANTAQLLTNIYTSLGTGNFRDITQGSAGSFNCYLGWDFVTGVGSPQGTGGF